LKTTVALTLLIVGTAMMVGGFAWAVWEFARMYGSAMDDPLNGQIDAKRTSGAMLTAAAIGIVGFVPSTIGSIMLGKGLVARMIKKLTASEPRT